MKAALGCSGKTLLYLAVKVSFRVVREEIYICYLPAGRSVLGKTVPEVLSTARGLFEIRAHFVKADDFSLGTGLT